MQAHQYLAIGIRLLAIVIFIYSLNQLSTFLSVILADGYGGMTVSYVFFFSAWAIPLLSAIVLWTFPTTIAKKVVPPESDEVVIPEKTFSILVALILTVGLCTLFYALVDVVYWATYLHLKSKNPDLYNALHSENASIVATAFEVIAALTITLRARSISKFLYNAAK